MRLIVDASVATKWFVEEKTGTLKAAQILKLIRDDQIQVVVPELFLIEVGNALRRVAGERKITYDEAEDAWEDLLDLALPTVADRELALIGVPLAIKHKGGAADAVYLALALREQIPVVTADERCIEAFSSFNLFVHLDALVL